MCILLLSAGLVSAGEIGPDEDLCAAIGRLGPGEELRLSPGDYHGGCVVRRGGSPEVPTLIRAAQPTRRPRIIYEGTSANVIEVRAGYVTIRDLEFGPTRDEVDAIRIIRGDHVTVERCRFVGLGGIAVAANSMNVRHLVVRGNVIEDSRSTAMYFGCHNGQACFVSELLVEGNYIRGVTAAPGQIGYGLEIKLNSSGVVRDNVILRTKGPGIMVYGAQDLLADSIVERNVLLGSATAAGIVIGGGPVIVRNNVSLLNAEGGVALENYQQRNLLRQIVLANNTIYGNALGGITIASGTVRGISL